MIGWPLERLEGPSWLGYPVFQRQLTFGDFWRGDLYQSCWKSKRQTCAESKRFKLIFHNIYVIPAAELTNLLPPFPPSIPLLLCISQDGRPFKGVYTCLPSLVETRRFRKSGSAQAFGDSGCRLRNRPLHWAQSVPSSFLLSSVLYILPSLRSKWRPCDPQQAWVSWESQLH